MRESPHGQQPESSSKYLRDAMGRVTDYQEWDVAGDNSYRHQYTYNSKSQVTTDTTTAMKSDGIWSTVTTYDYNLAGTCPYRKLHPSYFRPYR